MSASKKAKSLLKDLWEKQFINYTQTVPAMNWDMRKRAWHIDSAAGKLVKRCRSDREKTEFRQKYIQEVEAFKSAYNLSKDKTFLVGQLFRFYREIRKTEKRVSYYANVRTRLRGLRVW